VLAAEFLYKKNCKWQFLEFPEFLREFLGRQIPGNSQMGIPGGLVPHILLHYDVILLVGVISRHCQTASVAT